MPSLDHGGGVSVISAASWPYLTVPHMRTGGSASEVSRFLLDGRRRRRLSDSIVHDETGVPGKIFAPMSITNSRFAGRLGASNSISAHSVPVLASQRPDPRGPCSRHPPRRQAALRWAL